MICVLGSSGRIGGFLRAAWSGRRDVLWQGRPPVPQGWLGWDLVSPWSGPRLPGGVMLVLSGVVRGDSAALHYNSRIALTALDAAVESGARHVFLCSSIAVYGRPSAVQLFEEADIPAPSSPYGAAKLTMEQDALAWAVGHPDVGVTILRIGNVLGADALIGCVVSGRPVQLDPLANDPRGPLRSYIGPQALADVFAGLAVLAESGSRMPAVLNVAAPGLVGMAELLQAAGLEWEWAVPNPDVLPFAGLNVARLESLLPGVAGSSDATRLIADWRGIGAGK